VPEQHERLVAEVLEEVLLVKQLESRGTVVVLKDRVVVVQRAERMTLANPTRHKSELLLNSSIEWTFLDVLRVSGCA
jgi:hypothetical protein